MKETRYLLTASSTVVLHDINLPDPFVPLFSFHIQHLGYIGVQFCNSHRRKAMLPKPRKNTESNSCVAFEISSKPEKIAIPTSQVEVLDGTTNVSLFADCFLYCSVLTHGKISNRSCCVLTTSLLVHGFGLIFSANASFHLSKVQLETFGTNKQQARRQNFALLC